MIVTTGEKGFYAGSSGKIIDYCLSLILTVCEQEKVDPKVLLTSLLSDVEKRTNGTNPN